MTGVWGGGGKDSRDGAAWRRSHKANNVGRRLHLEGAERGALRGNVQRAVKRKFELAAAEGFLGAKAGKIGIVVLL